MEEVREQRVKNSVETNKQKEMIQRFADLKTKLIELKERPVAPKKNLWPGKDKAIRKEIQDLIKDEDYGFEGGTNIGKTTRIDTFINMLEQGSKVHIEKLKNLEAPTTVTYDSGRDPPRTSGNIQTFVKSAGGGGVGSGVSSRTKR